MVHEPPLLFALRDRPPQMLIGLCGAELVGRDSVPGAGEPAADPGTVDARRPWRRRGCMGSDVSSLESGAFYLY